MVKAFGGRASAPDLTGRAYSAVFHNFLQQVLCRFIESTDIMIAFNYIW